MSNKQKSTPEVESTSKKESTTVLEKIRRRTALLVGIVGLALVIFILESLLGSGRSIFGGDEMTSVGRINGHKIDRNDFVSRFEMQLANMRQRNQGQEADDNMRGQAIEQIWQQYIAEYVMKPEFKEVGIEVGDDELYERVVVNPVQSIVQQLTDPNTGKVNQQFSTPDGNLDLMKWRQAVQNVTGESEMAVRQMEDNVKNTRYFEKFRSLINKGLYITTAESKQLAQIQGKNLKLSYVYKSYNNIPDSTVKVSDSELESYYKEHSYLYMSKENTRRVEYVSFNVVPSKEDLDAIEKDAMRVASEFSGKTISEDSVYMSQESENGSISIQNMTKKTMTVRDSGIYTAAPGKVFGPYNEGAYFKIYKLQAINSVADSCKVRHILIGLMDPQSNQPKRTRERAKTEADSLLTLLKEKKVNFDTLVKTVSDDMGSKTNGGDYGWFGEDKNFVEPFKNAGLMGTKGNISVVATDFGYHIIEVLDVSKSRHQSYRVAQIMKLIAPSDETNQKIFAQASQFGGENNTAELFDKAVDAQKLTKRLGDDLKEGDRELPGLTGARELVKWAFTAKKGEVSVFSFPDKHVVAKLSGIKNKGMIPLEEIKDQVMAAAIKEKKGSMICEEFKQKAGNAKTIEEAAAMLSLVLKKQDRFNLEIGMLDEAGKEDYLTGVAQATKKGVLSKPIIGDNGVFLISYSEEVMEGSDPNDLLPKQNQLKQMLLSRSDMDVFNALKDLADIEDHKSRID